MTLAENRIDVVVVGGGLAGITAAVDLAEKGLSVTLLEARPWLGGATCSFARRGLTIDNGQHAFLRCCEAYRELLAKLADWTPPPAVGAVPEVMMDPALIMLWGVTTQRVHEWARNQEGGPELTGTAASPGVVEGIARVVRTVGEIGDVREGEILVCSITSPAWAPIFSKITAAVTDIGGVMSHAAIVCREYGMPAVVGTGRATSQVATGQRIRVDGSAGTVTILE